jgi:hypothetical protein
MRKLHHLLALYLLGVAAPALSQLPLNTAYDYTQFNTYPLTPPARDNYWIEVAASAMPVPEPAFVVPSAGWNPPQPGSQWISGTATKGSYPGTSQINPSYSIFRKCFCLLPGFKNPQVSFRVKSDDSIQVWLNSQMNTLLPPSPANFNAAPHSGGTSDATRFWVGRNCIYVLVEDIGNITGFNLVGSVSALGLMPTAAAGTGMSFQPCACETPTGAATLSATAGASALARRAGTAVEDDSAVIAAIVKIAEDRRSRRDPARQR